jgi:hypothetical protein
MKNVMLYVAEKDDPGVEHARRNLGIQVENSLELGWEPRDILLYANFPYAKSGVEAISVAPPPRPRHARTTAYFKIFCILDAFGRAPDAELFWYHDLDAYQLIPFAARPTTRDMAFCLYVTRDRLKVQGGSMFFTGASRPIFEQIFDLLTRHGYRTDELALTDLMGRREYLDRFEVLDYSYNLGDTDFALRYQLALKPIKVVHFHIDRVSHQSKFFGDSSLGVRPLTDRFALLLKRYGVTYEPAAPEPERAHFWRGLPGVAALRRALRIRAGRGLR